MDLPTVAVLLPYFCNIVDKFDLKLKDLAIDQCSKCLKLRAELHNAYATKNTLLVKAKEKELDLHHQKSDKGYVHCTMLMALCVLEWDDVTLEPSREASQPAYQAYPTKTEFASLTWEAAVRPRPSGLGHITTCARSRARPSTSDPWRAGTAHFGGTR